MGEWLNVGPNDNRAYLAIPDAGSGPGVLVLHAWWGLTPVFTDICDRLASHGFIAFAPDLYDHAATAATIDEAEALIAIHDAAPDKAEAVVLTAARELSALPQVTTSRIGAIGFSMGAYWALRLSELLPNSIGAVAAMYGTSDGDFSSASAAYQFHFAERDEYEPLELVSSIEATIRAAGRDVEVFVYPGTNHWFLEPNRPDEYDAAAADLVWERTMTFLQTSLASKAIAG